MLKSEDNLPVSCCKFYGLRFAAESSRCVTCAHLANEASKNLEIAQIFVVEPS